MEGRILHEISVASNVSTQNDSTLKLLLILFVPSVPLQRNTKTNIDGGVRAYCVTALRRASGSIDLNA